MALCKPQGMLSLWNPSCRICHPRSDYMLFAPWIFSTLGNRSMKSAFAAGVETLSPAGRSRFSARDGAANPRVWSARAKDASACLWSGSCWILRPSERPVRLQQINRRASRPHRPGLAAQRAEPSPPASSGFYACRADISRAALLINKEAFFRFSDRALAISGETRRPPPKPLMRKAPI